MGLTVNSKHKSENNAVDPVLGKRFWHRDVTMEVEIRNLDF